MRIVRIPKKNGQFRTIYAPNPDEMKALRECLSKLQTIMELVDEAKVMHGFYPGRSPVTNALQHVGFEHTLTMDLKDFFDCVTYQKFVFAAPNQIPIEATALGVRTVKLQDIRQDGTVQSLCFADGAARQGLPTSPLIANIAAAPMDRDILALRGTGRRGRFDFDFKYTRYADDLTFSFNDERMAAGLVREVTEIVERHGFKVNKRKTQLQHARAGRRMITGVAVDAAGVHPPRYLKRRLRAAKHNRNTAQARGLMEWVKLRRPKGYDAARLALALRPRTKQTFTRPATQAPTGRKNVPVCIQTRRRIDLQ